MVVLRVRQDLGPAARQLGKRKKGGESAKMQGVMRIECLLLRLSGLRFGGTRAITSLWSIDPELAKPF